MGYDHIDSKFNQLLHEPTDMREHMTTIKKYASRCKLIVEFGVYDCTSTWALIAGRPQKLTSYDLVRRQEVDEVEQAVSGSGTEFKFVTGDTAEIKIEETDLLFIDSMHTYGHLKKELALHSQKVSKFIVLHDTTTFGSIDQHSEHRLINGVLNTGRGLWPAVEEFISVGSDWKVDQRFTNCNGLTILVRS